MSTSKKVLSETQKARLESLEAIVSKGQGALVEMAAALLQIEREGLWRPMYRSMGDYCWHRWDMSASDTSRYLDGAKAIEALAKKEVSPLPTNVSQAYTLWQVADKKAAACVRIWGKVLAAVAKDSEKKVSAALIKEVAGVAKPKAEDKKEEVEEAAPTLKVSFPIDLQPILVGLQTIDEEIPKNQLREEDREVLRQQLKAAEDLIAKIKKRIG